MASDPNVLAEEIARTIEDLFDKTLRDSLEAIYPQRGFVSHENRTRLFAALEKLKVQSHNIAAQIARDSAWGHAA